MRFSIWTWDGYTYTIHICIYNKNINNISALLRQKNIEYMTIDYISTSKFANPKTRLVL